MRIAFWKPPPLITLATALLSSITGGKGETPIGAASSGENSTLEIYVDAGARGQGDGTAEAPFKSLTEAQAKARTAARRRPITVHARSGDYRLETPLVFTEADSGTRTTPVTYQADGKVVLSGAVLLPAKWEKGTGNIFRTNVPPHTEIDQLWLGEHPQWMARFPNRSRDESHRVLDGWPLDHSAKAPSEEDALASARTAGWKNPAGAFVHSMHPQLWGSVHFQITGPARNGVLPTQGGTQHNRGSSMHPVYRFVENVFEELDAPGEWFHDRATSTLYCYPSEGIDLQTAPVLAASSRQLIEFRGSAANPVRFVTLRGFTFQHTARSFMQTAEPLLRSDWTIHRDAALSATGAEDLSIQDCRFFDLGGNAVFLSGYNRRVRLERCVFDQIGASGIAFVGEAGAARDTRTAVDDKTDFTALDRMPGPIGSRFPADCLVDNCLIRRTGRTEKQTAGIQIALASRITVRRSTIHDVPRAGINIGTGAWGGHLIEDCDVFDTVQETGDHGSFNAWGRDRFWSPDAAAMHRAVSADSKLPFLDAVEPTVLRHNRWRCDHGWDIDLDDGASHYVIENNVLLKGGLKLREGYRRIVKNNVLVTNTLHPHAWPPVSGDVFTGNIVMDRYQPALMPAGSEKWGLEIDRNLFTTNEVDRRHFQAHGCDLNSIVGAPGFIDPAGGDFRIREDSPAHKIGFANFSMGFGVDDPSIQSFRTKPR